MIPRLKLLFPGFFHWSNLPAFSAFAALSAGIATMAFLTVSQWYSSHLLYLIVRATAIICLVSGVLCKKKYLIPICFFIAGALLYTTRIWNNTAYYHELTRLAEEGDVTVTGVIATAPMSKYGDVVFLMKVANIAGDTDGVFNGKLFRVSGDSQLSRIGEVIRMKGTLKPPRMPLNRFDFDERSFFGANGITGTIEVNLLLSRKSPEGFFNSALTHLRQKIDRTLKLYQRTFQRSLVRAAFLGEKSSLSSGMKSLFALSGLAHLLALSGLHAGIVLSAVYVLFFFMPVRKEIRHIAAVLILWGYLLFVGPVPSLARAVIMATVVIITLLFQRKQYPLQSLGIAGIVWLVLTPSALFQAGFQLSFLATAGILLIYPRLTKWCPRPDSPVGAYLLRLIAYPLFISLSVFLATVPVLLYHFGTVSLYSLFANVIAVPLMTAGMWLFFGALLLPDIFPIVNQLIIWLSGCCFDGLLFTARGVAYVPWTAVGAAALFPEVCIAWYGILIAAVTVKKDYTGRVLTGALLFLFCLVPAGYLFRRLTGRPQCIRFATATEAEVMALTWPDGRAWLFCSGSRYKIRRAVDRTVDKWIHHTPETKVEHVFTLVGNRMVSDSSTVSGTVKTRTGDTLVITGNSGIQQAYSCRFYHGNGAAVLNIANEDRKLTINTGTDEVITEDDNREEVNRMSPPFIVSLRKHEITVTPYR